MTSIWRLILLAVLSVLCLTAWAQTSEVNLFSNENGERVSNNPTKPTTFTFTEPKRVTLIRTYHWNSGRGTTPGRLSILDNQGRTVGSWTAELMSTYYWVVKPDLVFPAGTYTLVDSDPTTWAHNAKTGGAGFVLVNGSDIPADDKGRVNGIINEQRRIADNEKGPVRPILWMKDAEGYSYNVTRTFLNVGMEFDMSITAPSTEAWSNVIRLNWGATDLKGNLLQGAFLSEHKAPTPIYNEKGQAIGEIRHYRAEKSVESIITLTRHANINGKFTRSWIKSFVLTIR